MMRSARPSRTRPPQSAKLTIEIQWRLRSDWGAQSLLRRAVRHAATREGLRAGRVCLRVVGRRAMSALHGRYLANPAPTDVLTFDLGTDRVAGWIEGDVVICADVARIRAGARARPSAACAELALYAVHGVLHLAGYDDKSPRGFTRMHAREDELLVELGIGRVFDRDRGGATGRSR